MGLFSFSRKNKQEPVSSDGEFYSRADEESTAVRGRGRRKDKQTNDPVDPVLPEKKRARRRLVGAIALVLAAIIGLPMIFDSEPKPVADDITIQIPSKDKPANKGANSNQSAAPSASKTAASASLDPKEEIVATSNSPAVMTTAMVAGGAAVATVAVAKSKEGDKQFESVKPAAVDKVQITESKPDAKATQKTNVKTDAKVEPKSGVSTIQKSSDAPTKAKDKPKDSATNADGSTKAATEKNTGKYALQVAALLTQEKINELQSKLKKAGFTTFTQKVPTESGVSTRIRVGPYASKEEADKARAKLIKMGLSGTPVSN